MSLNELINVRRVKHISLNGGTYPLADQSDTISNAKHFGFDKAIVSINPADGYKQYSVCGRLTSIRKSGKICFMTIEDFTGSIQIIASKSCYEDYDSLAYFDLGDIVQVRGMTVLSKTNEQSILLESIVCLSKALLAPPDNFFGVSDVETKYRQRYLDTMINKNARANFVIRTYVIRAIRKYLEENNFLEVETPTLNSVKSGASAKPFETHHNALDINLFLRIAPELYLKRLLVGGFDKVFEIGRNYRNEGLSSRHNPEFTMLEFYEAYGNFNQLISYAKHMISYIEVFLISKLPANIAEIYTKLSQERSFTFNEFASVTMLQAVRNSLAKRNLEMDDECNLISDYTHTNNAVNSLGSRGERLMCLFETFAEPNLVSDYRTSDGKYSVPVFVTDYPSEVCPLARAKDDDKRYCDRFELFVDGRELANAFQELNNPDEQLQKFNEQTGSSEEKMDCDNDYICALMHAMPPAIGFGLGIDRLVMLFTNSSSIKDVILFPTLKPNE
jgi:lysyl-tRNA synthetase class 2